MDYTPSTPPRTLAAGPRKQPALTPQTPHGRVAPRRQLRTPIAFPLPDPTPHRTRRKQVSEHLGSGLDGDHVRLFFPTPSTVGSGRRGKRLAAVLPPVLPTLKGSPRLPLARPHQDEPLSSDDDLEVERALARAKQEDSAALGPHTPGAKVVLRDLAALWLEDYSLDEDQETEIKRGVLVNPFVGASRPAVRAPAPELRDTVEMVDKHGNRSVRVLSEREKRIRPKRLVFGPGLPGAAGRVSPLPEGGLGFTVFGD